MLTKEVFNSLYKTYNKRPASVDELDIALLFEHLFEFHDVNIDHEGNLTLSNLPVESPFHKIPLRNIHAIVNFEDEVAIVMHSSIIILEKKSPKVHIHLRTQPRSLNERFSSLFKGFSQKS